MSHTAPYGGPKWLHMASGTKDMLRHRDGPGWLLAGWEVGPQGWPEGRHSPLNPRFSADGEGAWGGTLVRAQLPTREGVVLACPSRCWQHWGLTSWGTDEAQIWPGSAGSGLLSLGWSEGPN